jgi:hypothetical protein
MGAVTGFVARSSLLLVHANVIAIFGARFQIKTVEIQNRAYVNKMRE